jgi:hypothetical protein
VQTEAGEKLKKESIISFADAVIQPWAMMIELIDASIADRTMRASRRSIKIAR